jgi:hypothetical protein
VSLVNLVTGLCVCFSSLGVQAYTVYPGTRRMILLYLSTLFSESLELYYARYMMLLTPLPPSCYSLLQPPSLCSSPGGCRGIHAGCGRVLPEGLPSKCWIQEGTADCCRKVDCPLRGIGNVVVHDEKGGKPPEVMYTCRESSKGDKVQGSLKCRQVYGLAACGRVGSGIHHPLSRRKAFGIEAAVG